MTKHWTDEKGNTHSHLEPDDDVYTLDEWKQNVKMGYFNEYDGSGCWLKDGEFMTKNVFDDVFTKPPEGATHVVWYNK